MKIMPVQDLIKAFEESKTSKNSEGKSYHIIIFSSFPKSLLIFHVILNLETLINRYSMKHKTRTECPRRSLILNSIKNSLN